MEMVTAATVLGPNEMRCATPAVQMHRASPTAFDVLLNGDRATKSEDALPFTFYGQPGARPELRAFTPLAAPTAGGSTVVLRGVGLLDLGDPRVRFGRFGSVQAAVSADGTNVSCVTPPVALAAAEPLAFSPDGITFGHMEAVGSRFSFYDGTLVHVSRLVPPGGPAVGGTRVLVLGNGFADHGAACRFGGTLVSAERLNGTALACTAPASAGGSGGVVAVEVTLNGDEGAHSMTADAVGFAYYNASSVTIASVWPLGGPAGGSTVVTVSGAGFVDLGGVYCRFGGSSASVVAATVLSSTQLTCVSPQAWELGFSAVRAADQLASDSADRFVQVSAVASCCAVEAHPFRIGSTAGGTALTPASCHEGCTALDACRYFTHSATERSCVFCADCELSSLDAAAALVASWRRIGPARSNVTLRLVIDGQLGRKLDSWPLSSTATFTYYSPQSLGVSFMRPAGGPIAAGTNVTVTGSGFGALGTALCRFGAMPVQPATTVSASSMMCVSPPLPPLCGVDDLRAWSADACSMPYALSPAASLPLVPAAVRVSINGQQFSEPLDPLQLASREGSTARRTFGGFVYFDAGALALSAVSPSTGPAAGGTLVTLTGAGFIDLGVKVGFIAGSSTSLAAATVGRGGALTCQAPAAPAGFSGAANVEVSLSGEAGPAMSASGQLAFTYV